MDNVIHDLKTQRQGASGGLPGIYKLIPIAFYLGLVLSVLLSLFFYTSIRAYKDSKITWETKAAAAKAAETKSLAAHEEIPEHTGDLELDRSLNRFQCNPVTFFRIK